MIRLDGATVLLTPDDKGTARVVLDYLSTVPMDRFPVPPSLPVAARTARRSLPSTVMLGMAYVLACWVSRSTFV